LENRLFTARRKYSARLPVVVKQIGKEETKKLPMFFSRDEEKE